MEKKDGAKDSDIKRIRRKEGEVNVEGKREENKKKISGERKERRKILGVKKRK